MVELSIRGGFVEVEVLVHQCSGGGGWWTDLALKPSECGEKMGYIIRSMGGEHVRVLMIMDEWDVLWREEVWKWSDMI